MINGKKILSDFKFIQTYSKYDNDLQRKETWEESVMNRIKGMHETHLGEKLNNPRLKELFDFAFSGYLEKRVLGSQRALQFGGEPILKHNAKMFNCVYNFVDRPKAFQEIMYWLLCGCGVGFSVQYRHVNKLPKIRRRTDGVKTFVIQDSIEGWADAIGVLISSYYATDAPFPEYQNFRVDFDYSQIRPEGSYISGGFKAPGHKGLQNSIEKISKILDSQFVGVEDEVEEVDIRPIVAYDILMHMSDAVLSGGVRRSATICIFSKEDQEMMNAKTGDWYITNPQRGRSNNSVALLKNETSWEEFYEIFESIRQFGEPAFVFVDDLDLGYNPCVEIGLNPSVKITEDNKHLFDKYDLNETVTGSQSCNLSEINGSRCNTPEDFYIACKQASILGTIQASYTDFKYLGEVTKYIIEREALLGVSITGFMNNPEVLLNPEVLRKGAQIVKETNKEVAELIGINQSARTTCVKPSGTASIILETASGIHGEHAPMYFRHYQINKMDDYGKYLKDVNPQMFEESVWSNNNTDDVVAFPIQSPKGSKFKDDLTGIKLLEYVKLVQENWVESGTNHHLCVNKSSRHNVSNTINVKDDEWDEVAKYIYENRHVFAGISLLSNTGDKDYAQAPFTEVFTPRQIISRYGDGALYASGLIVDGLKAFNNRLWSACDTILGIGEQLSPSDDVIKQYIERTDSYELWMEITNNKRVSRKLENEKPSIEDYKKVYEEQFTSNIWNYGLKKDWVRKARKFANKYFGGDIKKMTYCLKDVYNSHKWNSISGNVKEVDWTNIDVKPSYTDINTLGAISCSGGSCEIII
jgi:ribonucleoside-triphosphate reductase (thioredoxin)